MLSGLGAGRQHSLIPLARGHIAAKPGEQRCPGTLLLSMTTANKRMQLQQSLTEMQNKTMQVFRLYILGTYHLSGLIPFLLGTGFACYALSGCCVPQHDSFLTFHSV